MNTCGEDADPVVGVEEGPHSRHLGEGHHHQQHGHQLGQGHQVHLEQVPVPRPGVLVPAIRGLLVSAAARGGVLALAPGRSRLVCDGRYHGEILNSRVDFVFDRRKHSCNHLLLYFTELHDWH